MAQEAQVSPTVATTRQVRAETIVTTATTAPSATTAYSMATTAEAAVHSEAIRRVAATEADSRVARRAAEAVAAYAPVAEHRAAAAQDRLTLAHYTDLY